MFGLPGTRIALDQLYGVILRFLGVVLFMFQMESPSTSVVPENAAATMFHCEAPEIFVDYKLNCPPLTREDNVWLLFTDEHIL